MVIIELDSLSMGEEVTLLSRERPLLALFLQPHVQVKCVHIPVAGTSVSSALFLLAAFQLDFLEQVPGLSPQPGSVKPHHGLPLSGRFRAKLITCLPLWLIAGMFSGVTYHAGSLGRVFFVCTSEWNRFCFPPSQSCVEKQGSWCGRVRLYQRLAWQGSKELSIKHKARCVLATWTRWYATILSPSSSFTLKSKWKGRIAPCSL